MSGRRYPEEFKIEAVKQVTERGYRVSEVAQLLGVPGALHQLLRQRVHGSSGVLSATTAGCRRR